MSRSWVFGLVALMIVAIGDDGRAQSPESGARAFRDVVAVMMSPRCANCHISGAAPLQGDDSHEHIMSIKRGTDGRGTPAARCRACHQTINTAALHGPPGVPDWRLPPPETRMAWHGLAPAALCRNLKTPALTGGRTLPQLVDHVRTDPLVRWAWTPGAGRTLPPLTHEAFVSAFAAWIEAGAPCPEGDAR
jgi:hypothetical protein